MCPKDLARLNRQIDELSECLERKYSKMCERREKLLAERHRILFESGDLIEFL